MSGLSHRAQDTIVSIIEALECDKIPYAIARNYENYPDFGYDLDMYFALGGIDQFIPICQRIAQRHDWDIATHADCFSRSPITAHNVDFFRFYKLDELDYLQVDLLGGFVMLGLPLIEADAIISAGRRTKAEGIVVPSIEHEVIFRLLQIHSLLKISPQKAQRYTKNLLSNCRDNHVDFDQIEIDLELSGVQELISFLEESKLWDFKRNADQMKWSYLRRRFSRNPARVLFVECVRAWVYARHILWAPCGSRMSLDPNCLGNKEVLYDELDILVANGWLRYWTEASRMSELSLRGKVVMDHNGLSISWQKTPERILSSAAQEEGLSVKRQILLRKIATRHQVIYSSADLDGI